MSKNSLTLIADSGGTKTDWILLNPLADDGKCVIATFHTQGMTPIHQTPEQIQHIIGQELMQQLSSFPRATLIASGMLETPLLTNLNVVFYGSGCTPVHAPHMRQLLSGVLSTPSVEVYSDLMGAARALCQHHEGIACILGTGANSCLYDGRDIVQNTPALGYVLGDEGSGSVLGRLFMNAIFKNPAFAAIRDEYLHKEQLSLADIIRKVYHEPLANRFLATASLFIHHHLDNPLLSRLVVDNFRSFFRCNIAPYGRKELPVSFVGSMAEYYPQQLEEAAQAEGYLLGTIAKSPMEGLVAYHCQFGSSGE